MSEEIPSTPPPVDAEKITADYQRVLDAIKSTPKDLEDLRAYLIASCRTDHAEALSLLQKISLLKTNPAQVVEDYYALWEPLAIPHHILKENEPTTKDIPKLEAELSGLRKSLEHLSLALIDLQQGNATTLLRHLFATYRETKKQQKQAERFGILEFSSLLKILQKVIFSLV